jgi:transposase-like protein
MNQNEFEDKLNRQDFINFMKNLIKNSDNYKRNSDSDSYVIALDSGWGTGKSFFIELLKKDIEENEDNIKVVKYNAWKNDYCDNAFNPLFYDILNNNIFDSTTDKKNIEALGAAVKSIIKAFGKDVISKTTGLDNTAEEFFNAMKDVKNFLTRTLPEIEELNKQRESFENFKKLLKSTSSWLNDNDKRLVVIIDELDRCKPTFAIQTLEIVKHIFDIENLTFIFAIDIHQLSHSIECVYGQGIDSSGYLCRFFDYIAKLPTSDITPYIQNTIANIDSIPKMQTTSYKNRKKYCDFSEDISMFFIELYDAFELSLRDLDTIIQSYKIMLDNFLSKYHTSIAHTMYLFYLTLKYKNPELFYNLIVNTPSSIIEHLNQYPKINKFVDNNDWLYLKSLSDTEQLKNAKLRGLYNNSEDSNYQTGFTIKEVNNDINNCQIKIIYEFSSNTHVQTETITDKNCIGKILFYPDLQNWDTIKNYTYREYLHKQLEMYNFTQEKSE